MSAVTGKVGRFVGHAGMADHHGAALRYRFSGLPPLAAVYAVVAPSYIAAAQALTVVVSGGNSSANSSTLIKGNGTEQFWLATVTDTTGAVALDISGGNLAAGGASVSGLWIYASNAARSTPAAARAVAARHVCDPTTGLDTKGGQCLRVRPCDSTAVAQQFERQPCRHYSPAAAAGTECLSHLVAVGRTTRRWLNAEMWGEGTCRTENGEPLGKVASCDRLCRHLHRHHSRHLYFMPPLCAAV